MINKSDCIKRISTLEDRLNNIEESLRLSGIMHEKAKPPFKIISTDEAEELPKELVDTYTALMNKVKKYSNTVTVSTPESVKNFCGNCNFYIDYIDVCSKSKFKGHCWRFSAGRRDHGIAGYYTPPCPKWEKITHE
jgi:hypothetical protein